MSKGSGFKIEMSQSGDPSVVEASSGQLSISVPINLKRRSGHNSSLYQMAPPMSPGHGY